MDDCFEVCFCSDSCEHVHAFLLNVGLEVESLEHMTSG